MRYTKRFYTLLAAFWGLAAVAFFILGVTAPVVNGRAVVSIFGTVISARLLAGALEGLRKAPRQLPLAPGLRIVYAYCNVCDAPAWWSVSASGESFEEQVQSWHKGCPGRYVETFSQND